MSKYIIYQAESMDAEGWEQRKRTNGHHEAFTAILAEHFDSTGSPIPAAGHRLTEYVHVPNFADRQFPSASTHYRAGDWEVVQVETYQSEQPGTQFEAIVICTCRYVPVAADLHPLEPVQVSAESFGGDLEEHEAWQESQMVKP
ncbi:MAG: hypothetical protein F6K04_15995 [Leptolyngbya sp. SIO4C5]|nr:hypothetical protein [Leptolyngbya sp. SIO4C5]